MVLAIFPGNNPVPDTQLFSNIPHTLTELLHSSYQTSGKSKLEPHELSPKHQKALNLLVLKAISHQTRKVSAVTYWKI